MNRESVLKIIDKNIGRVGQESNGEEKKKVKIILISMAIESQSGHL